MVCSSYKNVPYKFYVFMICWHVDLKRNVYRNVFVWRNDLWQKTRKAVSAFSGPFPPLKGNVVASPANS